MTDPGREYIDKIRTGGAGALVLAVVLLSVLGCALVGGYFYMRAQQARTDLANLVPLRETVVVRADGPAVVKQIQGLSRLETSRYTLEKILDAERTRQHVPGFLAGEKLIFIAHGEVAAGLDLSKITENDVDISADSITLRLPKPEILYSRIDNDKSHVYSHDTGLFSRPDKDLESKVRAEAERQIRESAVEDGLLQGAGDNGRKSLRTLLASMGFTDIRFR